MTTHARRSRRGQIPLWSAVTLGLLLVIAVAVWTWRSTRTSTSDGKQEIVFWNAGNYGDDIYLALHKFEQENPQYRVTASTSVSPDITGDGQRLLCAVAGEVPPDLVWFDRFAIGEWASRGALTDLQPYLDRQDPADKERFIDTNDFYRFAIDEAHYRKPGTDDKPGLYGIPTGADIRLLYSNTTQLLNAGIVDEKGNAKPPTTWSELRADAVKLTHYDNKGDITRLGFAPSYGNSWLYLYAFQAGGNMVDPTGTKVTMTSPPVVRALRYMTDVYDDLGSARKVTDFSDGFQAGTLDPFILGQVSLKVDGNWSLDAIAQWKRDMPFTLTPAPMPDDRVARGDAPITWAGGFSLVIPSTARNKDGAFKLIQFLNTRKTYRLLQEGAKESIESQGQLFLPHPWSNKKLFEEWVKETVDANKTLPETFKQAYANILKMLPNTYVRPSSPIGQLVWNCDVDAYNAATNHRHQGDYRNDKDGEMKRCLADAAVPAQRQLDAILNPPPKESIVSWSPYFVGYGLLIVGLFALMLVVQKRRRRTHGYSNRETGAAMLFLSPWVIGMVCLTAGPILFSIVLSFTQYDVLSSARYVGIKNYHTLFRDDLFYKSLGNTAFMLIRIPLGMALSLAIAMLLNRQIKGIGAYRTGFYMPVIVPVVASALLWTYLLNPSFGLVNICLRWVFASAPVHGVEWLVNHLHHFETPFLFTVPSWLNDPLWSKPSIILMGLWGAGGGMIIWLAGLQSIPGQLYEAATVDGAGPWKQFLNVTVPMLSPYILFNAIMGVIGAMQIFGEAFIMTSGGPDNSTLFYAYQLFKTSFQYFSMGYASSMAWVLFLIVLTLTLVQLYMSKKWVHYDRT